VPAGERKPQTSERGARYNHLFGVNMKYRFCTKFWYDEDDTAVTERLTAFFRLPLLRGAVMRPRSLKLRPTRNNIAQLVAPTDAEMSSNITWLVKRHGKTISGQLSLTRNSAWTSSRFTSFLELRFSLLPGYKGGPFGNAEEVRDAALASMTVGPSRIGVVESEDEEQKRTTAKFECFRAIDDMAVPVSIEWVTILHQEVVANMGADLQRLDEVSGVRVGSAGSYWWILLCPEPLSFVSGVGVTTLEKVHRELNLPMIHKKFKRRKK
jgi:hypothetical protein